MNGDTVPYILVMAVCLILSAYFSATETAFSSLNKTRLKSYAEKGNHRAELALKLSEQYDRLISTILIGNNVVNIALASLGTVLFVRYLGNMGASVSTIVITVVVLIFGEITPKSIAKDCPERFAMFSAPIIRGLIFLLTPLNFIFSLWKKLVSSIFKVKSDTKISQEELLMLVEEVQQEGGIDNNEGSLLRNAIEFTDLEAEDILTHRVDLETISVETEKSEVSKVFTETKFSRLPVYEETVDNIIGVIHQKDFYVNGTITEKGIREIMTPPLFVRRSVKISMLLKLLQKNKSHVAIVLDEYGGTLGMVTMEDILEELVGEIWDEHDEVVEDFQQIGSHLYLVDCSISLADFCEFFDIETDSERRSVGGWVMEQLNKIPDIGETFSYATLDIVVKNTDSHRVTQIEVHNKQTVEKEVSAVAEE